jgi:hypothetical protein
VRRDPRGRVRLRDARLPPQDRHLAVERGGRSRARRSARRLVKSCADGSSMWASWPDPRQIRFALRGRQRSGRVVWATVVCCNGAEPPPMLGPRTVRRPS